MRKRCIRKVWAPVGPELAIVGAGIASREYLDRLLMRELSSLNAFANGKATLEEFQDMAHVNNVTQTLARMGIGREALPDCHKAEESLIEAARRFEETQHMGLSGPGLYALRHVIEWHDLQRSSISRSKYEESVRLTLARQKSGYETIDLNLMFKQKEEA